MPFSAAGYSMLLVNEGIILVTNRVQGWREKFSAGVLVNDTVGALTLLEGLRCW